MSQTDPAPEGAFGHAHLASTEPDGRVIRETVPVRIIDTDVVEVLGSPGLVTGCAAGDVVRVRQDGFDMVQAGPNFCVQAFADPPFTPENLERLGARFDSMGGYVEWPQHRGFLVVTVPRAAGVAAIAEVMTWFTEQHSEIFWRVSNV